MKKMYKALSLILAILMLSSLAVTAVFADDTPNYTTREDIVGYSAALVERKDLSRVTSIQKYWEDEEGDIVEYKLETVADVKFFSELVTAKQYFNGMTVYLANDIDFTGVTDMAPIGGWSYNATHPWEGIYFAGTFDGQGYAIKNLTLTVPSDIGATGQNSYTAFFRCIKEGAIVKNLVIDDTCCYDGSAFPKTSVMAGVVAVVSGTNSDQFGIATLYNVYNGAEIKHGGVAGGLVAVAAKVQLVIDHCTNAGDLTLVEGAEGASFNGRGVGGLVGQVGETKARWITVTITNSRNAGDINGYNGPAGGIVGHFPLTCYNEAAMTTLTTRALTIDNCINTGAVNVVEQTEWLAAEKDTSKYDKMPAIGGIVGLFGSTTETSALSVKNCTNYATVSSVAPTTPVNSIANVFTGLGAYAGVADKLVTLENNTDSAGQTDATLAEALWQPLVTIATPEPAPDTGDDGGDEGDGAGNGDGGNTTDDKKDDTADTTEDTKAATETKAAETTEASEEKGGCGSVIAAPIALIAVGAAALAFRRKED